MEADTDLILIIIIIHFILKAPFKVPKNTLQIYWGSLKKSRCGLRCTQGGWKSEGGEEEEEAVRIALTYIGTIIGKYVFC